MPDRSYLEQMTEEQTKQKQHGEGFSSFSALKNILVTRYRREGKAVRGGKEMQVTIDECGHVSAKWSVPRPRRQTTAYAPKSKLETP